MPRVDNEGYTSSAYTLLEYGSPGKRFGAELGLRVDHLYFIGGGSPIQTLPVFNPRINLDFTALKNFGFMESLSFTLGTGYFSSISDDIVFIEDKHGIKDFDLKPARSWTSVAGTKLVFGDGLSLNVEGYYKQVRDRAYNYASVDPATGEAATMFNFDGRGEIWGFDLMLQKIESRYWDGWVSYSFNHARYRDPSVQLNAVGVSTGRNTDAADEEYWPNFHRFHTLNMILNIKPRRQFNISTRFGFASGRILNAVGEQSSYPVEVLDENLQSTGQIYEVWKRASYYDPDNRTTWSFPMDIKFSYYRFNRSGKVQMEVYVAIENVLGLLIPAKGNTSFNTYTGEEDTGSMSAVYEMPIPIPSFGFRWSY
jgi:hypothetical protein